MTEKEQKRVDEIRAREAKATKGPWIICNVGTETRYIVQKRFDKNGDRESIMDNAFVNNQTLRFIASARSDIPFLLDLVQRQQEEIDALNGQLKSACIMDSSKTCKDYLCNWWKPDIGCVAPDRTFYIETDPDKPQ